jgi:hypothetical protein
MEVNMAEKEYIERGALLQRISLQANRTRLGEISEPYMTWKDVLAEIMCSPAADVVEVRHGEWRTTNAYPHWLWCSECHKKFIPNIEWIGRYDIPTNYCPNCGARMDGERKEATP